jgi:hypothetical protein
MMAIALVTSALRGIRPDRETAVHDGVRREAGIDPGGCP